ncbi:uncharacterized protein TNCV_3994181 [Trichonephila clavipes]|uniref:Uncharacterized protein n=1 Tax=Trichonephila clavipes TaxID=2585209 RepID=A0A8X6SWN4_TRICX|nr:uncharacterized protein TNCV_3994181 [Trichonephila clavipes]
MHSACAKANGVGGRLSALKNSMQSRKLSDGKDISGRGRLTYNEISNLQQYYGLAIRRNMNSMSDMFKAVWAIYFHKLSTDSVPQHGLCPTSPDNWYSNHKSKNKWRFEILKTRFNYWRCYLSLRKDIHAKQCGVRGIAIMLKHEVGMSVGCLMLMIVGEIRRIPKFCVDRVTAEMITGVITRMVVKEISGLTAGKDFRRMLEDLMIEGTNLEMGSK